MALPLPTLGGRGTALNPPNRFEPIDLEPDGQTLDCDALAGESAPATTTRFFKDSSRSIIARNDSPDVGFECSVNPYRGCEHGCVYCYARPGHEYLGWSSGLDFESKIMVKLDAPELLRKELSSRSWHPTTINFSGVTDCYQPIERRLKLTRQCIEVCSEFGNPISVITKNALISRDIDILASMARRNLVIVLISVTTLEHELSRRMEPRASPPRQRLQTIRALCSSGIPTGVMIAPVVPGLTDHEAPRILQAAAEAGAHTAAYVMLRLPFAIKSLFDDWLARYFPDRREKVLNRIRSLRGGKLNDSSFRSRMRGAGVWADQFKAMFEVARRKAGLDGLSPQRTTEHFRRIDPQQQTFW